MAEPYTPTVEQVRRVYSLAPVNLADCDHVNRTPDYAAEQFDRWLAEVRREAAEKAWGGGYTSGHSRAMRQMSDEPNVEPGANPYRQKETTDE